MSKDIRSFFTVKSSKSGAINSEPPQKKPELKSKKRPIIIDSDSDDEKSAVNVFKRSKPQVEEKKLNDDKKPDQPVAKSKYFECQHNFKDLFGCAPVKRDTSRKIIKRVVAKEQKEFHLDKDFEEELAKLDATGTENILNDEENMKGDEEIILKRRNESLKKASFGVSKDKEALKADEEMFLKMKKKIDSYKKADSDETNNIRSPSPRKRKSNLDDTESVIKKLKTEERNDPVEINCNNNKKESPVKNSKSVFASPRKSPRKTPEKSPYQKLSLTKSKVEKSKSEQSPLMLDEQKKLLDVSKIKEITKLKESVPVKKTVESKSLEKNVEPSIKITSKTEQDKLSRNETCEKKDLGSSVKVEKSSATSSEPSLLWVERYKPTSSKQIIGQQGDKSCVNKLVYWLKNWEKNQSGTKKLVKPSPWAKNDDGAFFKAALLSGPPGVGKTTSAHLVCKELGFDVVEFNASDTRSKRLLHEEVSELLSTKSLSPFFTGQGDHVTKKHVLLMDEVDGMAGNEDRGGVQELISLIKQARVPVICMCNDRNHPKIRSLSNYCFDLRFTKPRVEQIKGAMMSVCFKEKLKLKPNELTDIITSANQDIRLIMNHLSMLSVNASSMANSSKHIKLGPWDIIKKIFSEQDHQNMTIQDKCELFFHDYSLTPLFVQENYLNAVPHKPEAKDKIKKMELFAKTATSLSLGDLTEKSIRSHNAWGLLPVQAIFSSFVPGELLEGHIGAQINFPAWFGKNSRTTKMNRLVQELTVHSRLKISGNREAMNLDYVSSLGEAITGPLVREGSDGVSSALAVLSDYCLVREDMESIAELCNWPGSRNRFSDVDSKVKAAFTRAYNKTSAPTPYAAVPVKKGRGDVDTPDGLGEEEEGSPDVEDEEEEGLDTDAMIMVKKKPAGKKGDNDAKPSTSKGSKKAVASKRGKKK